MCKLSPNWISDLILFSSYCIKDIPNNRCIRHIRFFNHARRIVVPIVWDGSRDFRIGMALHALILFPESLPCECSFGFLLELDSTSRGDPVVWRAWLSRENMIGPGCEPQKTWSALRPGWLTNPWIWSFRSFKITRADEPQKRISHRPQGYKTCTLSISSVSREFIRRITGWWSPLNSWTF
jgi:hypothetical protein